MVRIFRSYNPSLLIVLLLVLLLLWLQWFVHPADLHVSTQAFNFIFYRWILSGVSFFMGTHTLAAVIFSSLLLFTEAVYFNYLINVNHILSKQSYLPAFCFLLLGSSFEEFIPFNAPMVANLFLLLALGRVLKTYKRDRAFSQIFDASFYTAIASLIFFPSVAFFAFVVVSLIFIRPFHLRELLISLVGFVLPFYLIGVYYYWNDQLPNFINDLKIPSLYFQTKFIAFSSRLVFIVVPLLLALIWSVFLVQKSFFKMVVQVRQSLLVFVIFFAAGIFSLFIQFRGELSHFCWAIIPLSLALSFFCAEVRRTLFAELLILFLILSILFFNFNFF